jgi:5'-nucleotidase
MGNTTTVAEKWQRIAKDALADSRKRSRTQGQDYFAVTNTEHMSAVDCFNGTDYRAGKDESGGHNELIQLPVISPRVDGRMEDVGRSA